MDITYYDSGYIDQNYYVYTAEAVMGLGTFIAEDYLEPDYFENTGTAVTLTCEATKIRIVEASADLVVNFSQSVNGVIDVRAEVTLVTIANLSSQEIRLREFNSDLVTEFTHTASASATLSPQVTFSSIASQLTAAFQNATGTITMESAFTATALVGVIKNVRISSPGGVDATSEPDSTLSPYLRFGSSGTTTPLDGYVSVSNSVNQTGKFIMSMHMAKPIGYVFDADPNRDLYPGFASSQNNNNAIQVETSGDAPYFYYRGNTGYVVWPLGPSPRLETLKDYSHYLLRVDITKSTNAQKYRLFKDGVEITGGEVHQLGGVGPGQVDTIRTDAYDIKITAFDQYHLMMNTSGANLHPDVRDQQGLGYGDSNGVKDDRSSLTQFWWDYDADDYPIEDSAYRSKFYDGNYLDLGVDGTATGLTRPKHYVRLLTYQDIEEQGTKRSVQAQWNWKKLTVDSSEGTNPVVDYLIAENYTATSDQNSSSPLLGIRSAFVLTVESVTVLEVTANLQLISSLIVTASKNVDIAAAVSSEFTTTTDNQILRLATVTLSAESELACTATIQRSSAVELIASSTVTVDSTRIFAFTVDLAAEFTATATVGETTEFNIALNCEFIQLTANSRTRDLASSLESVVTVTSAIDDRTRDQSAAITSNATLTVVYTRIPAISATLTSEFALSGDAEKLVVAFGTLTVVFTQTSTVFKVVNGTAALVVEAFELTQGDILNFDPCREIRVESETRAAKILPENRLIIVDAETRTLKVPQETRVLRVDYETRVNIIKC